MLLFSGSLNYYFYLNFLKFIFLKNISSRFSCESLFNFWHFWSNARYLKYTHDGLLIWGFLPTALPFKLEKRLYRRDDKAINESLAHPDKAVILQVDNYHWVVCLGVYKFAPWFYRIADPWFGRKMALPLSGYKEITGSAHLILKNSK